MEDSNSNKTRYVARFRWSHRAIVIGCLAVVSYRVLHLGGPEILTRWTWGILGWACLGLLVGILGVAAAKVFLETIVFDEQGISRRSWMGSWRRYSYLMLK